MKRIALTITAIVLWCVAVLAQPQSDSAVRKALAEFDQNPSVASGIAFFEQLQNEQFIDRPQLSSDASLDEAKGQVWYWAGEWFYSKQEYNTAVGYLLQALPLMSDPSGEADCLNLLAVTYVRLSDYNAASIYAHKCFKLDLATGDPDVISSSLNTLTAIYMGAKQPQEAEKFVVKGIEMARRSGNRARLAVLLATGSEVYHALGRDDVALKYIDESYDIDISLHLADRAHVRLAQKASVLIGLERYEEAELLLEQVIPLLRADGNRQSLGIACNKMGQVLSEQKRDQEAAFYYREAAGIFARLGDHANEANAHRGLYESLWRSDPEAAKEAFERFNVIKDSIYLYTSAENLARYNAEFGNDWLKLENHEEHRAKIRAIVIAIVVAVIAVVVWLLMYRRHRRQMAINKRLTADVEELRDKYRQLNNQYDEAIAGVRTLSERELQPADRDFLERIVKAANDLIINGDIDAAKLAARLGMSPFQLRQRLSLLLDETPQSFIQILRMQRACYLLRNHPSLSIAEVAQMCAYGDTSNFTRAFKREVGVSPSRYANLNS